MKYTSVILLICLISLEIIALETQGDLKYGSTQGKIDSSLNISVYTTNQSSYFTAYSQQFGYFTFSTTISTITSGYVCIGLVEDGQISNIQNNETASYKSQSIGFCSDESTNGTTVTENGDIPVDWSNLKIMGSYQYDTAIFYMIVDSEIVYSASFKADQYRVPFFEAQGESSFQISGFHAINDMSTQFQSSSPDAIYTDGVVTQDEDVTSQHYSDTVINLYDSFRFNAIFVNEDGWICFGVIAQSLVSDLQTHHDSSYYSSAITYCTDDTYYNGQDGDIIYHGSFPYYEDASEQYVYITMFEDFVLIGVEKYTGEAAAFAIYMKTDDVDLIPWFELYSTPFQIQVTGLPSCRDGQFLDENNNNTCSFCDNTVCATCSESASNCELECNEGCLTCFLDQNCLTCEDGKFLNDLGACLECDNTQCGTCVDAEDNCVIDCGASCLTCGASGECETCEQGQFVLNGSCQGCGNVQTRDADNNCECLDGYQEVNGQAECQKKENESASNVRLVSSLCVLFLLGLIVLV